MTSAQLYVKNPTDRPGSAPFAVEVPLTATVRELKARIFHDYPGNPPVGDQRLIFSGKLLADSDVLTNVLAGFDTSTPQTFHIVVSGKRAAIARSTPSSPPRTGAGSSSASFASQVVREESRSEPMSDGDRGASSTDAGGPDSESLRQQSEFLSGGPYGIIDDHLNIPAQMMPFYPSLHAQRAGMAFYGMPHVPFHPGMYPSGPEAMRNIREQQGVGTLGAASNVADAAAGTSNEYSNAFPGDSFDMSYLAHLQAMQSRIANEIAAHEYHRHQMMQEMRGVMPNSLESRGFPHQAGAQRNPRSDSLGMGDGADVNVANSDRMSDAQDGSRTSAEAARENNVNRAPQAQVNEQGPWRRQFVFQIDLNWSFISKIILCLFLLSQEGHSFRMYILLFSAFVVYLWQSGRLDILQQTAAGLVPSPRQVLALLFPAAHANSAQNVGGQRQVNRAAVLLLYSYSFLYGFFCSLIPSWEPAQLPSIEEHLDASIPGEGSNVGTDREHSNLTQGEPRAHAD